MKKKNNTLIIVLVIVGVIGICCCGGIIVSGGAGMNMLGKMNTENTAVVQNFMTRASATWDVNSVSDQIYTADNNAQRPEFTQIVFNELAKMGSMTKMEGGQTGFTNNTVNGVNTQTFTWKGTITMTNGTSPISFEMIKVGESWQMKDIYLN